jgi:4-hydroxybenzoate polyprenyltransferase
VYDNRWQKGSWIVHNISIFYGVNDIFDADIDTHNKKKSDREVRYEESQFVVAVVLVCGLLGVALVLVLS